MAYLDRFDAFSPLAALAVAAPVDFLPSPPEAGDFGHAEWTVIGLARRDGLDTLRQPRRPALRRMMLGRLLLGRPRAYNLADERLEALRRLAVEAWHRPLAISLRALGAFIAAGFSNSQLAVLLRATGASAVMARGAAFGASA